MKRLKKAAEWNDSFSIIGNVGTYGWVTGDSENDDGEYEYVDEEICYLGVNEEGAEYAIDDFDDETKEIIKEQCQEKCQEDEVVVDLQFDCDTQHSYMHVYCNKPFSQETKEAIMDVINGQYADGWGEGLEQHPFYTGKSEDYPGATEELCVQLWPDNVNLHIG
jgi:hypothetical protein